MNLEDVDRELDALAHAGSSNAERVEGGLAAVDALLAQLAKGITPSSDAPHRRAAAERAPNADLGSTAPLDAAPLDAAPLDAAPQDAPTLDAAMTPAAASHTRLGMAPSEAPTVTRPAVSAQPPAEATVALDATNQTSQPATVQAAPRHPDRSPHRAPSEPPDGPPSADVRSSETRHDRAAEDDRPRDVESSLPPAPGAESPLAELFSDLDAEVAELGGLFEGEAPSEDRLSLDLDELEGGLEAESTSIFTAADVAAIRRSSAPPTPTPTPSPSVVLPPPPATTRRPSTTPPPPPSTVAPEEELAFDDFELLLVDEEANDPDSSSLDDVRAAEGAPPTSEPEGDAALEGETAPESEAALEGDDESALGGEKKGFFKKLFR